MSIQAQPQKLNLSAEQKRHLHSIANRVCQPGKGVLATDDTAGDLGARLEKLGVENSAESRRHYRQILYTTPYINTHISAVILIEETFNQVSARARASGGGGGGGETNAHAFSEHRQRAPIRRCAQRSQL